MHSSQLKKALQHYFGYADFRLQQEAIITALLDGKDVLAIMPTGGGKSICYQLPALLMEGVTIVISPLIALMKDQVDALRANGIQAAFLNSTQSIEEQEYIKRQVKDGSIKLLYIAPERLSNKDLSLATFLHTLPCALFAIDEAHCISQWGHDFRPEYLKLAALKKTFPDVPVIALTASADSITRNDILDKLQLHHPSIYISSFNRANIRYYVYPKKNTLEQIAHYIDQHSEDCGIIYALSRSSTETIASRLREMGFVAAHYHAGMSAAERSKVQEAFQRDQIKIIVATIAFGMGIDKPNVRYVIHYDVPKNMEGYYQETGRAGRDGLSSDAILYYSSGDIVKMMKFTEIEENPEQSEIMLQKLREMKIFAESERCRRQYILNYFGEKAPAYCGNCDFCLSNLEKKDATIEAQKFLSAVYRTGERFGTDYIIDFLRGSASSKIQASHKELKTYGIGKDQKRETWQQTAKQLLHLQLLDQTKGTYPILKLNEQSWSVLRGEQQVTFTIRKEQESGQQETTMLQHTELLQHLKGIRRTLAEQENVPAYAIFGDNTLQELATYLPLSFTDMKQIAGLGDYKISKYGAPILDAIKTYAKQYQLESKIHLKTPKKFKSTTASRAGISSTYQASLDLFRDGYSIAQIAQERGISPTTVEGHLATFVASGVLKIEDLVDEITLGKILSVIKVIGNTHAMKPIKDLLGDDISYGDIRLVIAHYNANK